MMPLTLNSMTVAWAMAGNASRPARIALRKASMLALRGRVSGKSPGVAGAFVGVQREPAMDSGMQARTGIFDRCVTMVSSCLMVENQY